MVMQLCVVYSQLDLENALWNFVDADVFLLVPSLHITNSTMLAN